LDQAAPRNPVVFRTGPDASVNSLALEASGITDDWEVDDGGPGYAEKNPSTGKITGILRSCTRYLKYTSSESSPSREEHLSHMKKLFADYNRVGITGISERAGRPSHFALYQALQDRGELTVRAVLSRHVDTIQPIENIEEEIKNIATNALYAGNPWLQLRTLKIFLDGGMLTGSAYMREPWGVSTLYNISDPDYRGLLFVPEEKLQAIMAACMENDVQFSAHVVGDGAVHTFIDACAALPSRFDIRSQRPVICHSNFMSQAAVEQTAAMGICMDIQPAWLYLDGRTLFHHFGYDRLAWFQPLRALFAAGAIAGGGSDHMQKIGSIRSINLYDPWYGMWISMRRTARWLEQPLHEEHALSRVEAIRFYTINNAYIHLVESQRGSLEVGKVADFIVLDRDILTCPLDEVKEISVLKTYVDGDLVYSKTTD
jgi:predicted amidohydrolase YtcJ